MSRLSPNASARKSAPESTGRRLFAFIGATVIGVVVALVSVELVMGAAWSFARWIHPDPLRPQMSPAYSGAVWVPDLFREQSLRLATPYTYVPFRVSGVNPWHGKYFNNDEHPTGVWRRTVNPDDGQCQQHPKTSIWVFGGSTVYGTGVPDWATLPSYLSSRLNHDGRACVIVTNYGDESYASTQELILLIEQLKRGGRPDIVIFYDGFNDAHIGMAAADPWSTHYGLGTIKPRAEGTFRGRFDFVDHLHTVQVVSAVRQLLRRRGEPINPDELRARAAVVVDNYEANQNIARALGQTYHFTFHGFWQPMLFYGHKPLVPFERQISELDATGKGRFDPRPVVAAYQEAERRAASAAFVYLADVFDAVPEPIYIDEAHLGPHGNELAANAIAKYIEDHPAGFGFIIPKRRNELR
jgi:lysophospholipase L1-like esterase